MARRHHCRPRLESLDHRWLPSVFTPAQVRQAYAINSITLTGGGQTVAIIDAYHDAFRAVFGKGTLDTGTTLAALYANPGAFHDVVYGSNGYGTLAGYDLVTGLGTPNTARVYGALLQPANVASPFVATATTTTGATARAAAASTTITQATTTLAVPTTGPAPVIAAPWTGSSGSSSTTTPPAQSSGNSTSIALGRSAPQDGSGRLSPVPYRAPDGSLVLPADLALDDLSADPAPDATPDAPSIDNGEPADAPPAPPAAPGPEVPSDHGPAVAPPADIPADAPPAGAKRVRAIDLALAALAGVLAQATISGRATLPAGPSSERGEPNDGRRRRRPFVLSPVLEG